MKLHEVMKDVKKCSVPLLQDYSILQRINNEEYYFPSPLEKIQSDEESKVILFSAPGAVGKTSLVKHIAHTYGGLYWEVNQIPLSRTALGGALTFSVGAGHGSQQDQIYSGLKNGKCLLILDAFDEAVQKSSREEIKNFLLEVSADVLNDAQSPSVIMAARTEMASFIYETLKNNGIPVSYYRIDYFGEEDAICFILKYFESKQIRLNQKQTNNIKTYIERIKQRIGRDNNPRTFIGYAQVLIILSKQIETELNSDSSLDSLLSYPEQQYSNNLIFEIIQKLIEREYEKLAPFRAELEEKYKAANKEDVLQSVYCKDEQLLRLQFFVSTKSTEDIKIDDFPGSWALLPEDKDRYLTVLRQWLPEHVFLANKEVMPVFQDYLLAEALLNEEMELFAESYKTRLPTRVFMDCYLSLNNNCVNSEHIYYLDLAFSSQVEVGDSSYCEINSLAQEEDTSDADNVDLSLILTLTDEQEEKRQLEPIRIIREPDAPITLCRAKNMSICVDGMVILSPEYQNNVSVRKTMIECDQFKMDAPEILFETYGDEENQLIIRKALMRKPGSRIIIKGTNQLKVELPKERVDEYKGQFYEFVPYLCTISSDNQQGDSDSITNFTYGLKKVLEQFKVDNYRGDPAKYKEKIDARCHSDCKARVLSFAKTIGLIYEDGIMYKASLKKMDELHISRVAYNHFNYEQLKPAYSLYLKYLNVIS